MKTRGHKTISERASALIIVLWIAFGLVVISLYFGQSMAFELRAADNRVAALEADQAIHGATRYVTNILLRTLEPGLVPDANEFRCEDVSIGDARVWLIGRNDRQNRGTTAAWGLVDEGSKLNLNVVTAEMLQMLPNMTPELAAAMIDWRDSDSEPAENGGAESDVYQRLNPAYSAKNTNYESVAELRLVMGTSIDTLFGEDGNLNGLLDLNENDSENSLPTDNRDGRLDPGLMEFFTVFTRIPTVGTNIADSTSLRALYEAQLGSRAQELRSAPIGGQQWTSLLEFFLASGMTREEFAKIEGFLVCTNATNALININTASEEVLACVPGIGYDLAPQIVAYRQSNPTQLNTLAWLPEAVGWNAQEHGDQIRQTGPWICGRSFQLSADIAAVGHHGRGYKRVKVTFDMAEGWPKVRYRQDLTYLGWALGRQVRETVLLASRNTR